MEKIIHICFSQSSRGSIRHALSKKIIKGTKVIALSDDLSNGFIDNINLDSRAKWWNTIIEKDEFNYMEDIEDMKENFKEFFCEISKITDETIYIWHGENAAEICGLSYIISFLNSNINNIYIINVSKITYNKEKKNQYIPSHTGEISPDKLNEFIKIKNKIDEKMYKNLTEVWNKLKKENTLFRIYENGEILSVSQDYLDEFILGYTNDKFIKCTRVVGECLGHSKIRISDTFILWRILEMIKIGKVEYKGNLGIMREMEIKQGAHIYIRNYNKLIRDKIPEIIKKEGKEVNIEKLNDEEYLEALNEKLQEEVLEYILNNDIKELVDLVEVVYAILEHKKITIDEFEKIRLEKKNSNGGFKEKLFLMNVKKI